MLGVRTPFRVSFAGGSSDIQSYYKKHGGAVISTSINKYMYHFLHKYDENETRIKYSKTETVVNQNSIEHPIVKAISSIYNLKGLDITSVADFPKGTGLGSSSAYTVGLLNALSTYYGIEAEKEYLANLACEIEIKHLKRPIGKQDQYASAFGGLNLITFNSDETVSVENIELEDDNLKLVNSSLVLYKVGAARSAHEILKNQNLNIVSGQSIKKIDLLKSLVRPMAEAIKNAEIQLMGDILSESWSIKSSLSKEVTNTEINLICKEFDEMKGIYGYKLLGAGGGGYLLLVGENSVIKKLKQKSLTYFELENNGSKIIFNDD